MTSMKRDEFLKSSFILGGASLLPTTSVLSQSLTETGMDKLTDAQGNFALQPLALCGNISGTVNGSGNTSFTLYLSPW